jgi:ribosomal protein S21
MCYVEVRPVNENSTKKHKDYVDDALKELKRRMKKEGILQDLKRHESYMSPSQKKRFRRNEAMKRRKRDNRKQQWFKKKSQLSE